MIIAARFNGPPGSGNGGYSAGVFAEAFGGTGTTEVTLRLPPPLDTKLSIVDGQVTGPDGQLVAEVAPGTPVDTVVPLIGYAEAAEVSRSYEGFTDHPFSTCYGCGPAREDGLHIFPGRLGDGTNAAPWNVPADVSAPVVWAAMDCTGGWTVVGAGRPYVLGRIAVEVGRLPEPGDQCVVRGALAGLEGRRALVHTTLYGPDGAEFARSRATWIALPT
jgi:hypothetical protein